MARLARVVVPGLPHHVTQRGNRRQAVFFTEEDYRVYKALLGTWCAKHGVAIWAYCLMTNHVHLILVPSTPDGLRAALGETHRRYTRRINFREGWRGHLWQERFASFVMEEAYLRAAARYVELNPVQAGLVRDPGHYPWSSAAAHLQGQDDDLVAVRPLLDLVPDWRTFLEGGLPPATYQQLEHHSRTGRPLGPRAFVADLERRVGRPLAPGKPGPRPGLRQGS